MTRVGVSDGPGSTGSGSSAANGNSGGKSSGDRTGRHHPGDDPGHVQPGFILGTSNGVCANVGPLGVCLNV